MLKQRNTTIRGGVASVLILATVLAGATPQGTWQHFRGMCDASAVEMIDHEYFVVADDEDYILRVYSRLKEGFPVQVLDVSAFLRFGRKKSPEPDLEGAARIGDRIYWISSHGASANGKFQPSRHRFFATTVRATQGTIHLAPLGRPYANLLSDLARQPGLAAYHLEVGARLAPKARGALNIEGLAPTPEGHLLIGFRNPNPLAVSMQ